MYLDKYKKGTYLICYYYHLNLLWNKIFVLKINIVIKVFALTIGQYPFGIKNMLKTANLKQVGSIHNGIGKINLN